MLRFNTLVKLRLHPPVQQDTKPQFLYKKKLNLTRVKKNTS